MGVGVGVGFGVKRKAVFCMPLSFFLRTPPPPYNTIHNTLPIPTLHSDGSVISAVTLEQLNKPDQLYYDLGCKTAVGMPFKVRTTTRLLAAIALLSLGCISVTVCVCL